MEEQEIGVSKESSACISLFLATLPVLPSRGDREACNLLSRAGYYGVFVTTETVMAWTAHRSRDGEG